MIKLTALIFAVLLAQSEVFSESVPLWYKVSSVGNPDSTNNSISNSQIRNEKALKLKCPENISTYTDINICSADISNSLNIEILNGSLAQLTWIMEGATEAISLPYGINHIDHYIFNEGVTIISYTGSDNSGNTVDCSFTVVVSDNQAPRIAAPENISIGCNDRVPSPHTTLQAFLNAGGKASDNCSLNPATFKLESEQKSNTGCPFTITRTYEISDWQGNTSKVKQFISVEGKEIPEMNVEEHVLRLKSGMGVITSTSTGGDWNLGTSWAGGVVPLPDDDVIIVNGATIFLTGNKICNDITINGTVNCGSNTLQVDGSWENNGIFNAGSGTVEFAGTSNATISGSSSTVFKNFRINKGAVGNVLQINKDIQLGGTIAFISGLMQINSGVTVSCTFNAGFTIENNAGLFINGGIFTTGAFPIDNDGLFRIDSGTANIGSSSGNSIVVRNNGTFDINGGTVNVAGRLEVSGGTADISGGTINLNTVGQNSSTKGTLDLSLSSDFAMSNGIINFLNPNGTGNFDVIILNGSGGSKSFSGGTFNFGDGTTDTYKISSAVPFPVITSAANTNLEYKLLLTSTGTFNFPLVDNLGNAIPATVQINGGSVAPGAFVEIKTTGTKLFENKNLNNYLKRYWTVFTSGVSNYDITANYANSDIVGTESKIVMAGWSGSLPWEKYSTVNSSLNTVTATGISATNLVFAGITSDPPTVTITPTNSSICNGSSTTLTANPIGDPVFTYSWTSNPAGYTSTSQNITVTPTLTTTYTVTVTDGNGFTASDNIVVTVEQTLQVSVSIAASANPVCAGTLVTFTATPANGGTTPVYQWKLNGSNVGTNSNTFTSSTLSNGDLIMVEMTSSETCAIGNPAPSPGITMVVNPLLPVSVSIVAAPAGAICAGASVTFTATPTNGGSTPVYQWKKNNINIGPNSNTYTDAGLLDGDQISVVLTSDIPCPVTAVVTSNVITMTVTPNMTVTPASPSSTCINKPMTNITHTTTGATGIGAVTGLPAGLTATWASNTITISGTPSVVGPFNYSIPLTGGCGTATATGTITVNPDKTMTWITTSGDKNPSVCINNAITNIIFSTTEATGATFTGLPPGVSGVWNANTVTISGTPTTAGSFPYTIILNGGCGTLNQSFWIYVKPLPTLSEAIQQATVCDGTSATINLTGLLANSTSTIAYTINGIAQTPVTGVTANASGAASFITAPLTETNNGQTLQITGITVTSAPTNCSDSFTQNVTLSVDPASVGGTVASSQTICNGTSPADLTLSGHTGNIVKWQRAGNPAFTGATDITVTTSTLTGATIGNLTTTTYFRAVVQSGICNVAYSTTAIVTVQAQVSAGTIASNQTICFGFVPTALTGSVVNGIGTITYLWEQSNVSNSGPWTAIPGQTAATFQPVALFQDTWFHRITVSTLNGNVCYSPATSAIKITVRPEFIAPVIGTSQSICYNTTAQLNIITLPSGGSPPYTYQWQSSVDNVNWINVGASSNFPNAYNAPALTISTNYHGYRLPARFLRN